MKKSLFIKIFLINIMLCFLSISWVHAASFANSEQETNNTKETANNITANTLISGNLQNDSDVDWYKLELTNPGKAQLSIDCSNGGEIKAYVVNSKDMNNYGYSSYMYIENNYKSKVTGDVRLPAGTYYIEISPATNNYKSVDYTFKLNYEIEDPARFEQETNNTKETANNITANMLITGDLHYSDIDWYKLELTSPGKARLSIDSSNDGKFRVNVINSKDIINNGYTVSMYIEDSSKSKNTGDVQLTAGIYYIEISPVMNIYKSFNYTFELSTNFGNNISLLSISQDQTLSGNIDLKANYNGDLKEVEYYIVPAGGSGNISPAASSNNGSPWHAVYDTNKLKNGEYDITANGLKDDGSIIYGESVRVSINNQEINTLAKVSNIKDGEKVKGAIIFKAAGVPNTFKKAAYYLITNDGKESYLGDSLKNEDEWAFQLDTTKFADGLYKIKVTAYQTDDIKTVGEPVSFTIANVINSYVNVILYNIKSNSNKVNGKLRVGASINDPDINAVDYYIDSYYITTGVKENNFIALIDTDNYSNGVHGITANGRYLKSNNTSDMIYGTTKKINIQNSVNNETSVTKLNKALMNQNLSASKKVLQYKIVPSKSDYYYPQSKTNQRLSYLFMKINEYMGVGVNKKGNNKAFPIKQFANLKWVLGAKNIVKLDGYGTLTAIHYGVCDLYLESKDGKIYDSVEIVVSPKSIPLLMLTDMPPKNKDNTDYYYYHAFAIDKLSYKKTSNNQYKVTMDIYNAMDMTPVLSVSDASWKYIDGYNTYIEAFKSTPSNFKDVYNNTLTGIKDLGTGNLFKDNNRSESMTKKTHVEKTVQAGSLISISTSFEKSPDVLFFNMCDIVFKVWENTDDYKDLIKTNKFFSRHPKLKDIVNRASLIKLIEHKVKKDALVEFRENLILKLTGYNPAYNTYIAYKEIMNFFKKNNINLAGFTIESLDAKILKDAAIDTAVSTLQDALLKKMPGGNIVQTEFAVFDSMDITLEIKQLIDAREALTLYILVPTHI